MGKKLYVGNLSYNTTEDGLRRHFEAIGPVAEAAVITDRETGRARGFGFVTMENEADAAAAISELDGKDLDGRNLKVAEANPPRERTDRGDRGGDRGRRW